MGQIAAILLAAEHLIDRLATGQVEGYRPGRDANPHAIYIVVAVDQKQPVQ